MRLKKEFVEKIAKKIVASLIEKGEIIWEAPVEELEAIIADVIVDDLMVEDRLNEEVKMMLESNTDEYDRRMMDYGRAFQLVKSKLARERGLIF
jgi:hypothetical protein|tara:strand:- start:239 stop:520 length:282 start_codon:yes stop_codon:yes gene_type:complete